MSETNTPVPDVDGLIAELLGWERIERAADLPRSPEDTRVADVLARAAQALRSMSEALGQISRMKLSYDRAINQTTLSAAITIARRQALGDSHG